MSKPFNKPYDRNAHAAQEAQKRAYKNYLLNFNMQNAPTSQESGAERTEARHRQLIADNQQLIKRIPEINRANQSYNNTVVDLNKYYDKLSLPFNNYKALYIGLIILLILIIIAFIVLYYTTDIFKSKKSASVKMYEFTNIKEGEEKELM